MDMGYAVRPTPGLNSIEMEAERRALEAMERLRQSLKELEAAYAKVIADVTATFPVATQR